MIEDLSSSDLFSTDGKKHQLCKGNDGGKASFKLKRDRFLTNPIASVSSKLSTHEWYKIFKERQGVIEDLSSSDLSSTE